MANNVNNKIGCSAGKTTVVDPNNFDGHDSSSNMSVPLEDLNISVVLRTYRKGRTVLTDDGDSNTRESSKTVEINFIEGSDVNGKKVLTTKFTDLTVVGDSEFNDETLGITSIDIDFNSSYAPMVNVNFIDVRGSSIFQNEENISGNNTNNKYATFFQLPYPLFELEVKGYYGKPVTYCLHMLKFTSKFNSKTGNFEIQCQFVGYTYAMLSDMLIGYLKANEFTKIGAEKYEKYNSTRSEKVLTLVELMTKISKINEGVEKIASNSENSKLVNATTEANDELDAIQNIVNTLGSGLDYDNKTIKDKYDYIIKLSTPATEIQKNVIELYKKNVEAAIDKFNALNAGATLTANDFKTFDVSGPGKGLYSGITKGELDPTKTDKDTTLSQKLGSPKDLAKLKKDIYNYIKANYTIADNLLIDVYNLELLFEKITAARTTIDANGVKAKEDLALELKDKVAETLGFQPTVRRIVEIFSASIEVFMETIYEVSRAAEAKDNTDRQSQLEKKFTTDLTTDIKKEYIDEKKFFPWPDYREKDEKTKSYVEKYLGEAGVLENPKDVNELVYIDDLLAGFIKAAKASEAAKENEEKGPTLWYPINPLDSNVFVESEPYSRTEIIDYSDITRLMVLRGMTFLGYSNDTSILTEAEILGMAQLEAEAILRTLKDDKIKQTLTYLDLDFIKKITGFINGVERPVIKYSDKVDGKTVTPYYYYDYIFKSNNNPDTHKLIPITQGFNKAQWGDGTSESKLKELATDENLFLTNYSDAYANSSDARFLKYDDGGTYIKILKPEQITSKVGTLATAPSGATGESKFILSKLKEETVDSSAGYNSFGGVFGVQEYVNMDFGDAGTDGLPLMYVFYKDFDNGLAFNRKNSGIEQKTSKNAATASKYDLNTKGTTKVVYEDKENAYLSITDSFYVHTNLGKNRTLFNSFLKGNKEISYPYIELRISGDNFGEIRDAYTTGTFSLFGSKYYYLQDLSKCVLSNGKTTVPSEKYAKALLFLHTLPFNLEKGWSHDPFGPNEIIHLFDKKAGFIHAPRLWCAYIGSILWRLSTENPKTNENGDIISGGSGKSDPMIYKKSCDGENFQKAENDEYFPKVLDILGDLVEMDATLGVTDKYAKILKTHVLLKLPAQVKNEFKRMFFEFVNGTDGMISFDEIKQKLEIWSNSSASFCNFVGNLHNKKVEKSDEFIFNTSLITTNSNVMNVDSYSIISPVYLDKSLDYERNNHMDYLFLELKGDYTTNPAITTLIDAMTQEVVIANTNYKIWGDGNKIPNNNSSSRKTEYESIYVDKPIFDGYFNAIIQKLKEAGDAYSPTAEKKKYEQEIFGTSNEDTIKLQLYRTCKNIHDKWLSGTVDPNNIIFQCGSGRNAVDSKLALRYGNTKTRLIDSFRFVTRSFRDIGEELFINPLPINDYLLENQNTSSYDAISSMLASNNFDFVALPSFINFKDPEELESLFKPYGNYGEAIASGSCGPSFVCVYVGQKSKHLDFKNSQFPNDSFDLRCNDGNLDVSVPQDFTTNNSDHEDPVAVFTVKYGQQNQNIFKDIELDQSEFTETDESIQIQEDISQKGAETNRTIAGQNLYNVYSVRSYTAEVEMMGNVMIQPMMYFQLDNIPMFHGAYMITRVRHSIKPNNMSTNFTGVRIKVSETPLIDAMDLYMSFLDSLDTSKAGTGGGSGGSGGGGNPSGSLSPVSMTIFENGGLNGRITAGNIKTKLIPKIAGIDNLKINNNEENQLLSEAVDPLVKMLNAWIVWMKENGFKGNGSNYANITSVFRDYDKQVQVKKDYGSGAATPGSSPHGWGVAVDLQFYRKDGTTIKNTKNTASSFNTSSNPALKWILDNSYVYGWVLPYSLRDQVGLEEHWHFEYHGTAAKCLMEKNPSTYGFKVDVTKKQDASVLNPLTKEGKRAVYTSCDYKSVKDVGDGTEKSSTLTDAESKENQKKTKIFFKSKGYTKQQTAGIMGNIQQESRFNPSALNKKDLNGYASFGLIQWNEKYTTRAEAGATLDVQLNHLIGMSTFKKWAALAEPKTSVEQSTFQFANIVEICHKCNKGFNIYKDSYQYVRTQFANDIYKRFNDKNDPLFW